jgi:hypothetical protein
MALTDKYGQYQVHSELGRGGMAVVYKCWEESLNRFVAKRKSTVLAMVFLTLSLLYFVLSKNEINAERDVSTDFVSNDVLLPNQQFYEDNDWFYNLAR